MKTKEEKTIKVLVGLSGGVDSSLCAKLLKDDGFDVLGCYLKMFESDSYHKQNMENVAKISKSLDIDYIVRDISNDFSKEVYTPFIEEYKRGRTPNPCALCNRTIKFKKLLGIADEVGCECIATGHYVKTDGNFIYEGDDKRKDQSYFLFFVRPSDLKRCLFPLASYEKSQVKKAISQVEELKEISEQKESLEICFVEKNYRDILRSHVDSKRGEVVDLDGRVIGYHDGYINYTIGQRRGFTLNPPPDAPRYVVKIIAKENKLVVGTNNDLFKDVFEIRGGNFFVPPNDFVALVRVRYLSEKIPCSVSFNNGNAIVRLQKPARAVAPGQAAVFYDGNKVLGGGWIV